MKQHWENEVELDVFASEIPPVGLCPGFVTVCDWQGQKWAVGLGTNRDWREVLPSSVPADQTDETEQPEHKAERGAGTRGALQPPSPMRGWR